MIRYANSLSLTDALRETMRDGGEDFPFVAIETDLAWFEGRFSPWHWHDYVEFAWVTDGVMECHTPDGVMTLEKGEGYFVNSGVLHANHMAPGCGQTRFRVIQFSPRLLSASGRIARRYILPVERCAGLRALPIRKEDAARRGMLDHLGAAFAFAEREGEGWELRLVGVILDLWSSLYGLAVPLLGQDASVRDDMSRWTKAMLDYIHRNYAEAISVADIARAASISPREAHRAFRRVLDTTPTLYLSRHRVNVASRMLREGGMSVTDIAIACGFSTPNYFCKVFRDVMGQSPRDFRKAQMTVLATTPNP